MIVKSLSVSVAVSRFRSKRRCSIAVAGDRQVRRRPGPRSRCHCVVFVRSRVPNVAESVIVWGEFTLKMSGSNIIVFGPERPLDGVVLAQASAVLKVPLVSVSAVE